MEETVTIITVSYNSTDVIEDMLSSVPSDVSVLVVECQLHWIKVMKTDLKTSKPTLFSFD